MGASRSSSSGRKDRAPRFVALSVLSAGLLLSLIAAPRFNAAIERIAGDAIMNRVATRQAVAPPEIDAATRSRRSAQAHVADAATLGDLALLRLVQARRLPAGSNQRSAAVEDASAFTRAALRRAPASSYLWMRLAETTLLHDGLGSTPVGLLRQSLLTGPFLQGLSFPRLELAFLLEPYLDDATRQLVRNQVLAIAAWKPDRLAESTRRRYTLKFVRDTLASDRARLDAFDDAYAALR